MIGVLYYCVPYKMVPFTILFLNAPNAVYLSKSSFESNAIADNMVKITTIANENAAGVPIVQERLTQRQQIHRSLTIDREL